MLINKNIEDYTDMDVITAFEHIKNNLKSTKETIDVGGMKIKYVDYHETSVGEDGQPMGYQDELVYVGKTYFGGKYVGDSLMGMHERDMSTKNKRSFLKDMGDKDVKDIVMSELCRRALTSGRKLRGGTV